MRLTKMYIFPNKTDVKIFLLTIEIMIKSVKIIFTCHVNKLNGWSYMVKNCLKKVESLFLAGIMIFSSIPARAWEGEDQIANTDKKIKQMLKYGFQMIEQTDYISKGLLDCLLYGCVHPIKSCSHCIELDKKYFSKLCEKKGVDYAKVVYLEVPSSSKIKINIHISNVQFPNLRKIVIDSQGKKINMDFFSACPNLEIVEIAGDQPLKFIKKEGVFSDVYASDKDISKLFRGVAGHKVNIVVDDKNPEIEHFRRIKREYNPNFNVYSYSEIISRYEKPMNLCNLKKGVPEVITSVFLRECYSNRYSQLHPSQNIIIPKNVKKIEKNAFKNANVKSVIFEEGIKELELCNECFAGCNLYKFELPKSLKKITLGKDCFKNCDNPGSIENYIRGEMKRIAKEEEEERERKRKEEEERIRKQQEEEEKSKAKELAKKQKENEEKINKRKEKINEEIEKLNKEKIKAEGVKEDREADFKQKKQTNTSLMNEIELKIFTAELSKFEAKFEAATIKLDLIEEKLKGKSELLKALDENLDTLMAAKEVDTLLVEILKGKHEVTLKLKKLEERIKLAEEKERKNEKESKRLSIEKDKQAQKDDYLNRKERSLQEQEKKLKEEKSKSWFSGAEEKISSITNPIKSVTNFIQDTGHKVVAGCKIALGVVAAGLMARAINPIANLCISIKKFFQTKNKKTAPQELSNSTSATTV